MSVLFIFAVVRGALIGWLYIPSFIVRLPGFVKLIIFLFIILYSLFWLKNKVTELKINLFNNKGAGLAFLGFYSSLW